VKAAVLQHGSPESAGMDPSRVQRLHDLVSGWVAHGDTPSVIALVARRGIIVMHDAFGVRCHGDPTPTLKTDSIFPLSSCSKPITAAAVMCLADDGSIGLNRPFVDYVPELDVPEVKGLADARVADLLCHAAGIDDFAWGAFIAAAVERKQEIAPPAPGQHPRLNARIRLARGAPLTWQPGKAFAYSNLGYNILGDIVRRVSGKPFWQFVQSRLFEPLGMRDSYFVLPAELRGRRVYRKPGMPATEQQPMYNGIDSPEFDDLDVGASGALSTARDLATFMQMLLNRGAYAGKRVLSAGSVRTMTRDQVDPSLPTIWLRYDRKAGKTHNVETRSGRYGYGLALLQSPGRFRVNGSLLSRSVFGHGGNGGTYMWADPERELVGVYLSVSPRFDRDLYFSNADLFQNAVQASVAD
jgi:CubicO group peptidase (beta-lactamase class C family)